MVVRIKKIANTTQSTICIFNTTKELLLFGLSIPLVTADAASSSAMEADRIIIGINTASKNTTGRLIVIPLSFIAANIWFISSLNVGKKRKTIAKVIVTLLGMCNIYIAAINSLTFVVAINVEANNTTGSITLTNKVKIVIMLCIGCGIYCDRYCSIAITPYMMMYFKTFLFVPIKKHNIQMAAKQIEPSIKFFMPNTKKLIRTNNNNFILVSSTNIVSPQITFVCCN